MNRQIWLRSLLIVSTLVSLPAAAEGERSLRSVGKLVSDRSIDLGERLRQARVVTLAVSAADQNATASMLAARGPGRDNRHDQLFEIYTADVELIADLDGDGHHHAIRVVFDADVSVDSATVYARLFLSREGEPWSHYYTTDLFQIRGDSSNDTYEIETELLDGYYPGYYAVLIELYSLDHVAMVASEVLDYHYLGRDVRVESLDWDEPVYGYYESVSVHGAASIGGLLLFFLLVQVMIAARGVLARAPLTLRLKPVQHATEDSRERKGLQQQRLP